MPKLELVTAEVCPFAQRSHMTLLEKNLEFQLREVDLENKPSWFETISTYSKVPVFATVTSRSTSQQLSTNI